MACRREQPFWHVDGDNLVWHVDGSFGMLTRRIPPSERSCEYPGEIRYGPLYDLVEVLVPRSCENPGDIL